MLTFSISDVPLFGNFGIRLECAGAFFYLFPMSALWTKPAPPFGHRPHLTGFKYVTVDTVF